MIPSSVRKRETTGYKPFERERETTGYEPFEREGERGRHALGMPTSPAHAAFYVKSDSIYIATAVE